LTCLDYRRALLAGVPENGAMKEHRLQCVGCRALLAEHASFEDALRGALQVAVPPDFERRLTGATLLQRRRFLAAAAVGALAIGVGSYAWVGRADPLAVACIEFVVRDEAKAILKGSMPRDEAETALAGTLPLWQIDRMGQVRHVGPCPFNGQIAYHVILEVPQGKVTLLVMPESSVERPGRAERAGLHSAVVPLPAGAVGIIGADAAVVDSVAGAVRNTAV
jgi:hypothetical protein